MKIISDKSMLVILGNGRTYGLPAGEPTELTCELAIAEALTQGARPYRGETDDVAEAVFEEVIEETVTPEQTAGLDTELVTALEKLLDEGDPTNFKTDGYPKAAVVNGLIGRSVSATERNEAWESILNS